MREVKKTLAECLAEPRKPGDVVYVLPDGHATVSPDLYIEPKKKTPTSSKPSKRQPPRKRVPPQSAGYCLIEASVPKNDLIDLVNGTVQSIEISVFCAQSIKIQFLDEAKLRIRISESD